MYSGIDLGGESTKFKKSVFLDHPLYENKDLLLLLLLLLLNDGDTHYWRFRVALV